MEEEKKDNKKAGMRRALNVRDILNKKYDVFPFEGKWKDAFDTPEVRGCWFVWGNSGNGKTSFVMQLCKELCKYDRVAFNSLEEGTSLTVQNNLRRFGMAEVSRHLAFIKEDIPTLKIRLRRHKSFNIVIIDSFQYTQMTYRDYIQLKEEFPDKLFVFISHACGMGAPLPREVVRGAMLLRCNALARGNSGIRLSTLETLLAMLNRGVHPVVPEKGSLGASGDLAPLSHIVLVMLGEGEAEYQGAVMPGRQAMESAGISPVELAAKEGLALINGTQIMAAIACGVVYDAVQLAKTADLAAAMTCEAQLGILSAYDPEVHALRGQQGQMLTAQNLLRLLDGSRLALTLNPDKVQDAYSIRCVPQIHGASRDAIRYVWDILSREINAVTDNPLIFPGEDKVISGGNFHGQPVALAMDFLGIALSEYANVSERRLERMVNPALSNGLPAFLTKYGGVHSGFMITQYAAASMVSENKVYAHPASVDSIPSSANQEDHVSMGTTAARKARMILDNSQKVIGIELLAAVQALWLRGESLLAPATAAVYQKIRQTVPPVDTDVVMYPQMAELDRLVKSGALLEAAEQVCGRLL